MIMQTLAFFGVILGVAGAVADSASATAAGLVSIAGLQVWTMGKLADLRERLARLEAMNPRETE